ncbi:hypothetical protein O3P69_008265 [Scylla paramamosain]|uniref:Uncharacterized protein n=1 Tax=Scylla paramamosain TaxID=85552 RepID=A0AAW0T2P6_SCYPA
MIDDRVLLGEETSDGRRGVDMEGKEGSVLCPDGIDPGRRSEKWTCYSCTFAFSTLPVTRLLPPVTGLISSPLPGVPYTRYLTM